VYGQEATADLVDGLIRRVPRRPGSDLPDWSVADAYTCTHLASHANEAGRLDEFLDDPLFLIAVDPSGLLQVLNHVPVNARPMARLYRRVAHHLAAANLRTRAAILRDAAMRDEPALVPALAFHFEPAWNTLWTDTRTAFHQTLTGHRRPNALAVARLQDGRTLLASGGEDAIRVWEPTTGLLVREFAGHTNGPVTALAFTVAADGRVLLASAGYDDIVRVWDVGHDDLVAELRGHMRYPTGVVWIPGGEGLPQLVSASMDGTVRWWDIGAQEERRVLNADRAGVLALAAVVTPQDGLLLAGAGRSTTTVILLDPISGSR
jgi:hypothetical protein